MLKYLLIAVLIVAGLSMIGFSFGKNAGESKNLVTYEELQKKLTAKENFILLDVRTHEEFADGHIPGSILLPYDAVRKEVEYLRISISLPIDQKKGDLYG